jgi:hypothetical protein
MRRMTGEKSAPISVDGRVMVNDVNLAVRPAVDGLGIAYIVEALAEPFLRSGQLVRVLEEWWPTFEGLYLYYPGHRQVPATLRALIDMIRTARARRRPRVHSRTPSRRTERIEVARRGVAGLRRCARPTPCRFKAVPIRARCENACGKFPACRCA